MSLLRSSAVFSAMTLLSGIAGFVGMNVSVSDALFEMTSKGYGATVIFDEQGEIAGVFTDGDLRRLIGSRGVECLSLEVGSVMTRNPLIIQPDKLAVEAVRVMERRWRCSWA